MQKVMKGITEIYKSNTANLSEVEAKEILKNGIASLVVTVPALIQYCLYGVAFHVVSFICMFLSVLAFISYFRINLKILTPLMVISFYNAFLMISFGRIFGQFDYLAVISSDAHIMQTFLAANHGKLFIAICMTFLFIAYLRYFVWSDKGLKWVNSLVTFQRRKMIPVFVISVLPFFCVKQQELLSTYPFACMSDLVITYKFDTQSSSYSKLQYKFVGKKLEKEKCPTFVIVVGESARRDAFGFNVPVSCYANSPNLDQMVKDYTDNFTIFRNYISTGQSTVPTVLTMFNPSGTEDIMHCFEKPNLIKLLSEGGYDVSIAKNQDDRFLGVYLNVIGKTFSFHGVADREMISVFDKVSSSNGKVVVMHTIGNHVSHCGLGTGNYLKGILETNLFLKELFGKVLSSNTPTCAWYVSDHGENLDSGDVHGSGNITLGELEVPSVVVANDAFKKAFPEKWDNLNKNAQCLLTHNNFSQTVMGLMNVFPEEYYNGKRDISSDAFIEEKNPLLMPNNMIPIRYKYVLDKKQEIIGCWN